MTFALAVHGGAGAAWSSPAAAERDVARRAGLVEALRAGHALLAQGGSAVDAVIAAVCVLEDAELFNAGRGSALRADGSVVMDASVMAGAGGRAGGVTGVRRIRNPILAARAVMDASGYVLLFGAGAEAFAAEQGLVLVAPEYFVTDLRSRQPERAAGTVGAVACDGQGHLAAATSTGGMSNASPARVGDSPLIGAGTWADDATCAVSATGHGEAFIRAAFAHEVDARMRLGGLDLELACVAALARVRARDGAGGCVAVDTRGRVVLRCTTQEMPRGRIDARGTALIALRAQEPLLPV